jgi:hypothetical protein
MATTPPPFEPPATPPPPGGPFGGPPPPEPPAAASLPWETPGYPALEGLYETAKLILLTPVQGFTRMPVRGDLGRPLLYVVIFGWIGIIASQIYNIALRGAMWSFLPRFAGRGQFAFSTGVSVGVMILAPIFVLIGVFVWGAILHLFLMLVGWAANGFTATIRTICYASTVQVVQVLPLCGGLVAGIWALVLYIIGLAHAHRLPGQEPNYGKAALAVLLPIALCCACVAVAIAVFGASLAALLHQR